MFILALWRRTTKLLRYTIYMTIISRARFWLLVSVLFGGACALHPSISLPLFDFSALRIGFYQLLLITFVTLSLPLIWQQRKALLTNRWLLIGASFFFAAIFIGLVFAASPLRSLLYAGSLAVLLVVGLAAGLAYHRFTTSQKQLFITVGLWSGIIFGILAIGQLVVASFEPTALGTLCRGCSARVFGFPRINGFAAEPQFFASSLLPAFFLAFFFVKRRLARFSLFFTSLAIILTFSRGAFIAIVGALIIYSIISFRSKMSRKILMTSTAIAAIGTLTGFLLLLSSAVLRFPDTPHIAYNTTASMLDQLSLGTIKLPQKTEPAPEPTKQLSEPQGAQSADFTPAGYVEASSSERLDAADLAIKAWLDQPRTILFGVGLGNLGPYLQSLGINVPTDQTVYIMYILLLASLGIIGISPLVALIILTIWRYRRPTTPITAVAFSLTLALAFHFWFFGSLINAVHCFAWIGLLLYNYGQLYAKKF